MVLSKRDELREVLVERQNNTCVVCGCGLYGDAQIHESIAKRSDLPKDSRLFNPVNCVALHGKCHENTKRVDQLCVQYLIGHYGLDTVVEFIEFLEFKVLPGMAQEIVNSSPGDF